METVYFQFGIIKKRISILLLVFSMIVTSVFSMGKRQVEVLSDEIYSTFINTLKINYELNSEEELCLTFLEDFLKSSEAGTIFLKGIDSEFIFVCDKLFDRQNYYHFYEEYIKIYKKLDNTHLECVEKKYPTVPFKIFYVKNCTDMIIEDDDVFLVFPNLEGDFFTELCRTETVVFEEYKKIAQSIGEINMIDFAKYLIDYRSNGESLSLNLRKLIAVTYWKYLCFCAKIDFHKPLDSQLWYDEFNIEK